MPEPLTPEALAGELETEADAVSGFQVVVTSPPSAKGTVIAPAHAALTAERDSYADRLKAAERAHAKAAAQRHELHTELQEIHDALVTAYGRDDLSEDTPAVVSGLIAERDRYRSALEATAASTANAHTLRALAREALEGGHG